MAVCVRPVAGRSVASNKDAPSFLMRSVCALCTVAGASGCLQGFVLLRNQHSRWPLEAIFLGLEHYIQHQLCNLVDSLLHLRWVSTAALNVVLHSTIPSERDEMEGEKGVCVGQSVVAFFFSL